MKIKTKLLLILSTLPLIIFLLIGTSWLQISGLQKMSDTTQSNYESSFLASQIHREIKNMAITLRDIIILTDQAVIEKELILIEQQSENVRQSISLLETKVTTAEHKELLEDLINTTQEFNVYKAQVINLISSGDREEAIQLMHSDGRVIHNELLQIISVLTDTFEENMNSSFQSFLIDYRQQIITGSIITLAGLLVVIGLVFRSVWQLARRLNQVSVVMNRVANGSGDLNTRVEVIAHDEIDDVAISFNKMVESLDKQTRKEQDLTWVKTNIAEITTSLTGMHELETLSRTFLTKIVPLLEASQAVFYIKDAVKEDDDIQYKLIASYAFKERKHLSNTFTEGEGLVGQAVLEKTPIILTDVPSDYVRVKSGLGEAPPLNLYVLPIIFEGNVNGVIELASFKPFTSTQQTFLEETIAGLGIIIDGLMRRIQLAKALEESQILMEEIQAQSEELQSQQEELRITNEELEEQTQSLRQSEEKLQLQQEELEQTNSELKEKALRLEERNKMIEFTNKEMEMYQKELEEKAKQLALSSKYKSEFLANMSHELRTPLNSLLLLSKLLADNQGGNLNEKQVQYAKTIYSSGNDLLALINDILDLAKIESGKVDVNPSEVVIADLAEFVESTFRPLATDKGLQFNVHLGENLPRFIFSDQQKIQQVLKNLLSNAFKFTFKGNVTLEVDCIQGDDKNKFYFSVKDTGVGIPKDKQELIFHAFQQVDGTTSRKFGGTGLGLSISREIADRLGGDVTVNSEVGMGSTFTFYVSDYNEETINRNSLLPVKEAAAAIEKVDGIPTVPTSNSLTEPPIETVSVQSNHDIKRLLIVDDDMVQRNSLMEYIGDRNVIIKAVSTGTEAIEELKVGQFDCIVLDLGLSDTSGFGLLEKIKSKPEYDEVKVFIYTGRDLSSKEEMYLNKYAHTIIIKDVHSPQRLKDELTIYLNPSSDEAEEDMESEVEQIKIDPALEGKKILLVDDDVRNVYALSSILELYGLKITFAENGVECLDILKDDSDFDLILMDIMMPEMDGYETIQKIRAIPDFLQLPVIALTAKAMKEDREKCMEAGASDYIMKPIDPGKLISLIRVWLFSQESELK